MNFHKATYTATYGVSKQLPPSSGPEVSFCGRSNVGKSSLLNKLMYRKGLAKVSATPGKTSTINFYDVDGADFVDLPGYGYAKVSKQEKARWSELIEGYYNQTRAFSLVVILVDIRHDVSKLDLDMIDFISSCDLPYMVVFTKADKLSKSQAGRQVATLRKQINLPQGVKSLAVSSQSGAGIEELRTIIAHAVDEADSKE